PRSSVADRSGRPRLEGEARAVEHLGWVDAGWADIVGGERAAARSFDGRADAPESGLNPGLLQVVPGVAVVLWVEPTNDGGPSDEPSTHGQRDDDDLGDQQPVAAPVHRSPVGRFTAIVDRHVALDYDCVPRLALTPYDPQRSVVPGLEVATSSSRIRFGMVA